MCANPIGMLGGAVKQVAPAALGGVMGAMLAGRKKDKPPPDEGRTPHVGIPPIVAPRYGG